MNNNFKELNMKDLEFSLFGMKICLIGLIDNKEYHTGKFSREAGGHICYEILRIQQENLFNINDKIKVLCFENEPTESFDVKMLIRNIKTGNKIAIFLESDKSTIIFQKMDYDALAKEPNLFNFDQPMIKGEKQ
jgi:hypothetical protein